MEKTLDSFFRKAEVKPYRHVYLASADGFKKYCEGCEFLVKAEETGSGPFVKRVFCAAEKCVK